ncbi:hypothetical protein BCR33DRAFT_716905 [Rhizoclosmatium globosum]|uniref:Uncharacterized protein n=1 Tax=Rhizoclosmatium globosum TaxID=329046 RepID=A0A1Y2CBT2_9FUNG|nr:hypothetical protein HDU79_002053 [Rhizoclosmatium sp. JEL0117]KAJ3291775.1 hypothetical protein HDU79_002058 [Rhizoclosmatium sp. JEL0117]ORY44347.1 hypothetical protein BCR33DRAFT_716905 [Rhizoclosmatium globosum]|eukprot:ORY44347.1 hypothetical protein BCR33DRAFT_716905 [Rhizoclosmatium globosum]
MPAIQIAQRDYYYDDYYYYRVTGFVIGTLFLVLLFLWCWRMRRTNLAQRSANENMPATVVYLVPPPREDLLPAYTPASYSYPPAPPPSQQGKGDSRTDVYPLAPQLQPQNYSQQQQQQQQQASTSANHYYTH